MTTSWPARSPAKTGAEWAVSFRRVTLCHTALKTARGIAMKTRFRFGIGFSPCEILSCG
jgi:hypothetical protein